MVSVALLIVGKVFHAVFLFLVAALIALLLDPLVRSLERLRIPRGFSIAIVYLSFAAALVAVVIAVSVIVIDRTQSAANRIDSYLTTESGRPPQTGFEQDCDRTVRTTKWVVHSQKVGRGDRALKYLAPYVFRVALTNNRLVSCLGDIVTYRVQDSTTKTWRTISMNALKFIHRFMKHVLLRGFVKTRYYGLWYGSL